MQKALRSPLLSYTPMLLRLAQINNCIKISADSTSIRDEISAELTSNCIEIDANSTSYIKRNEIGPVLDCTRGANPHV